MVEPTRSYGLHPRARLAQFRRMQWPQFVRDVWGDDPDDDVRGYTFDIELADGRLANYTATRNRTGGVRIGRTRPNPEDAHMFEGDA